MGGATAVGLGVGEELGVDFDADDGLVAFEDLGEVAEGEREGGREGGEEVVGWTRVGHKPGAGLTMMLHYHLVNFSAK